MFAISNVLYFAQKDPFDCSEDHCHLAWIIRDEPELLEKISCQLGLPACSNGTLFRDLDPSAFADCPIASGNSFKKREKLSCSLFFSLIYLILDMILN